MKEFDFLNFLDSQSNIKMSEILKSNVFEMVKDLKDNKILETITQNILKSHKRFINDNDFIEILYFSLSDLAQQEAMKTKIKKWKKTRYEEEIILKEYFIRKLAKSYNIEWIL